MGAQAEQTPERSTARREQQAPARVPGLVVVVAQQAEPAQGRHCALEMAATAELPAVAAAAAVLASTQSPMAARAAQAHAARFG